MLQGGVLLWPKKPLFTMARWDLYSRGYLLQGQPQKVCGRGSRQPARILDPPAPTSAAASRTVGKYENCPSSHFTAPTLSPGQSRQFWPQSSPSFCLGKVPLSFPCKLLGPLCFLKPKKPQFHDKSHLGNKVEVMRHNVPLTKEGR